LHFIDNLDPESFAALLAKLPLATTRFVAISKSGGTGETLMQTMAALAAVREAGLSVRIPDLFLGLTELPKGDKRSGLRRLLETPLGPRRGTRPGLGRRSPGPRYVGPLAGRGARPRHRPHPRRARQGSRAGARRPPAGRRARGRRRGARRCACADQADHGADG